MSSFPYSVFVISLLQLLHLLSNFASCLLHDNWHSVTLSAIVGMSLYISANFNLLLPNALSPTHTPLLFLLEFL